MVMCTSLFQRVLYKKIFMKNFQILRKVPPVNSEVLVHLKNTENPDLLIKWISHFVLQIQVFVQLFNHIIRPRIFFVFFKGCY